MSDDAGITSNNMQAFFTRSLANEGKTIPLSTPDGVKTNEWIKVLGVDSDPYKLANTKAQREISVLVNEVKENPDTDVDPKILEIERNRLASIVVAWSFGIECTFENVVKFLKEAPQIADVLDIYVHKRELYFAKKP